MIVVILAGLGLIFGSFVNAFVYRLHEQETLKERKKKPPKKQLEALSITKGRSMCPSCKHELAVKDLIPVVSWLWLRGRCRYCGARIPDSPLVELAVAALFVISYIWWPLSLHGVGLFQFVVWLGFVVMFVALATYDLRWFILPNKIVYPLLVAALMEVTVVALVSHDLAGLWEPLAGGLLISGLFWTLFQASNGKWIGGGDVKLAAMLGLLAGTPIKALLILFFSSVLGTLWSIPLLMKGKQGLQARVPFGPFLLGATVIVVLFGASILNWYSKLLG